MYSAGSDSVVIRLNYRHTSSVALLSTVVVIVIDLMAPELAIPPVTRAATITGSYHVAFNPCMMWEHIGWSVRLSVMIWFITFIILLANGLRNRPAPRWLAFLNLLAIILPIQHELWRYTQCFSKFGQVEASVWLCTALGMAIHQLIQPAGLSGSRSA